MKKYLFSIILFLVIAAIYSYKLFFSFDFHPDFARDIYDLLFIVRGKLTLIGPKTSFGGIYNGPYYYYLFAPVFFLTRLSIYSLLIFNVFLFLAGLIIFYILVTKKYGIIPALLSTLIIGLTPFYLTFARMPWNGSTYIPFLLIFFALVYFHDVNKNKKFLFLLGLLAGLIINIEMVTVLVLFFVIPYLFFLLKRKIDIFYFLSGLSLTFLPLVLFELRHDFVMIKNTFLFGSYKNILVSKTLSLEKYLNAQTGVNLLIYITSLIFLLWKNREKKSRFFILGFFFLFIIYLLIFRNHLALHYLFPLTLFMIFTLIASVLSARKLWILALFLLLEIFSFPKNIYSFNSRKPEQYEITAQFILENKIVKKSESYNLVQYSKIYKFTVPVGNEYRFFFAKNGSLPKSQFEYNSSDTLLFFSEVNNLDLTAIKSWEIEQFGKIDPKKTKKYQIKDIILYKITK